MHLADFYQPRLALRKAYETNDSLEKARQDSERRSSALVYDLREKLDFANAAKKRCAISCFFEIIILSCRNCSLQNYVSYVKSTYSNVFEGCENKCWLGLICAKNLEEKLKCAKTFFFEVRDWLTRFPFIRCLLTIPLLLFFIIFRNQYLVWLCFWYFVRDNSIRQFGPASIIYVAEVVFCLHRISF